VSIKAQLNTHTIKLNTPMLQTLKALPFYVMILVIPIILLYCVYAVYPC